VVGRYIRFSSLRRLRRLSEKIYTLVQNKIYNPELHDTAPLRSSPDLFHFRPSYAITFPQSCFKIIIKQGAWTTLKSETSRIMNGFNAPGVGSRGPRAPSEWLCCQGFLRLRKPLIRFPGSMHIKDTRKLEILYSKMQTMLLLFCVMAVGAQPHRPIKAMSMHLATSPLIAAQQALSHAAPDYPNFGN